MTSSFGRDENASAAPPASETFLRDFHTRDPGCTSRAFARAGSYPRFAAQVPPGARVLDLACGDGALLEHLPGAVGIDLTHAELARSHGRTAVARAEALPFAAGAFDAVACHLAFMLFPEPEAIVRELARVLVPGGTFLALLGGGPTADGDDAFHRFLSLLGPRTVPALGDPRTRSETGWRALFANWDVSPFERWTLDLGGTFEEVWRFLGASYEASPALEARLRAATAEWEDRIPCTAVAYVARAVRRGE